MVKIGFFKRSAGFIATTLCVAMISTSFAGSKKDKSDPDPETSSAQDDGNNGNGNDPSGSDPSNPGKGKGNANSNPSDDGNNGNGNDPSGSDPSNPGKGKSKGNDLANGAPITNPTLPLGSVFDLLGVGNRNEPEPSDPEPGTGTTPTITPPSTVTNNPFDDTTNTGNSQGNSNSPASNTSLPYGSVPIIANDAASIEYLLQKLLADARTSAQANGRAQELTPAAKKVYEDYARKLAKTLSKLTPEQQKFVFYGVKS